MTRPAAAIVNLSAIRDNYRYARELAPDSKVMAIVKANAYGHGAIEVSQFLEPEADAFGVACIEEALELRDAGIEKPILLLEGFFEPEELNLIVERDLWTVIHSEEQLAWLTVSKICSPITVWLKVDIGMHRLGILPQRYFDILSALKNLPQVAEVITMGHLSSADDDPSLTDLQIKTLKGLVASEQSQISLANSAGCLAHSRAIGTWQRTGIMLYGVSPFSSDILLARRLKPAMTLISEVIAIREIDAGESVGYSGTWTAKRRSRIATVAMGYADGYPRHAKSGTPVRVGNHAAKLIGRVSMDMLAIDVTDIPTAKVGTKVELWGNRVSATEVAKSSETIPYTLFTGITRRVHITYET
jgi:alanine racemase